MARVNSTYFDNRIQKYSESLDTKCMSYGLRSSGDADKGTYSYFKFSKDRSLFQRRKFTKVREEKVRRFSLMAANSPWKYGSNRSSQWYAGVLKAINEPGVVSLENVFDWIVNHSEFFNVVPRPYITRRYARMDQNDSLSQSSNNEEEVVFDSESDTLFKYLRLKRSVNAEKNREK